MTFTPEQEELWTACGCPDPQPSGDQTKAQAVNMAVAGFQRACDFMGVEAPSEEDIRAKIAEGSPLTAAARKAAIRHHGELGTAVDHP